MNGSFFMSFTISLRLYCRSKRIAWIQHPLVYFIQTIFYIKKNQRFQGTKTFRFIRKAGNEQKSTFWFQFFESFMQLWLLACKEIGFQDIKVYQLLTPPLSWPRTLDRLLLIVCSLWHFEIHLRKGVKCDTVEFWNHLSLNFNRKIIFPCCSGHLSLYHYCCIFMFVCVCVFILVWYW